MKTLIHIVVFLIIYKRIDTQFINNPSGSVDACNGGTAYFNWTFNDTATPVLFVEWKKNGGRIALEQVASGQPFTPESSYVGRLSRISNAQISLGTLAIADSGTYTSEVSYFDGTGDGSNSIRLTVYDVLNNKTEIDETSGILTPSFIDSSITYTWTSPDNTISIRNSLTVTVSGNYTLCVSEGKASCLNPTIDPCAILYVHTGNENESSNDEDKVGVIVGSVIAVVAGIAGGAALIVFIYKRKSSSKPSKPSVTVELITQTTAEFTVTFKPKTPPPTKLKVTVTFQTPRTKYYNVEVADGKPIEVTVKLEDLTPSTSYWFEFAGENDAGEGPARTVSKNTQAFGTPERAMENIPFLHSGQ